MAKSKLKYKGVKCWRGHIGWRYRSSGSCVECLKLVRLRKYHDPKEHEKELEYQKRRYYRMPEKYAAGNLRRRKASPRKYAIIQRKAAIRMCGITFERYEELFAQQKGKCAICRASPPRGRLSLYVDHDHACCPGKKGCSKCVRGLLCSNCNSGLGMFKDDSSIITKASKYLTRRKTR